MERSKFPDCIPKTHQTYYIYIMGLTKKSIIEEDKIKIILDIDDIVSKVTLKDPVKRNNIPNQNFALLRNVSDLSCASPVKTDHYAIIIAHRGSSLKT